MDILIRSEKNFNCYMTQIRDIYLFQLLNSFRNIVFFLIFILCVFVAIFLGCGDKSPTEPEEEETAPDYEYLTEEQGLPNTYINDIAIGSHGTVWFATNGGLAVLDDSVIYSYREDSPLPNLEVLTICFDALDQVWVGTETGAACLRNDNTWRVYGIMDGLAGPIVYDIVLDNLGSIWFATNGGLNYLDNDSLKTVREETVASGPVYALTVDWANRLYVATAEGIITFQDSVWTAQVFPQQPPGIINFLGSDAQGNVMAGTTEGLSFWTDSQLKTYTENHGLSSNDVRDVAYDRIGGYWVATSGGLNHLTVINETASVKSFKTEIGYFGFNTVAVDRLGNLWFGSPQGVGFKKR